MHPWDLCEFRERADRCLTGRADALFDLADAVLCGDGPVTGLAELSLVPQHRRGHGAGYDAAPPSDIAAASPGYHDGWAGDDAWSVGGPSWGQASNADVPAARFGP